METAIDKQAIAQKLRDVIDPELGVNIVDLGLVYNIFRDGEAAIVEYTATTPGCPMRRYLQQKIEEALQAANNVQEFEARLIWEPEWTVDMIKGEVDFFAYALPTL